MKKIIGVIIIALLIVNCSSSDDDNPGKSSKRLVKIVSNYISDSKGSATNNETITIKYGSNGFVSQIEEQETNIKEGKTERFVDLKTYTYNSSNQLIEEREKSSSGEVEIITYAYNDGLITSSVHKSGESVDKLRIDETNNYFYTNGLLTEQITKVNDNEHKTVYKHDANGNITKEEDKYNTTDYTYNDKINPVYAVFPPAYSKTETYASKNLRIKSVETQKNNDTNGTRIITTTYEYNSDGLPIKSVENKITDGDPDGLKQTTTTTYEYE